MIIILKDESIITSFLTFSPDQIPQAVQMFDQIIITFVIVLMRQFPRLKNKTHEHTRELSMRQDENSAGILFTCKWESILIKPSHVQHAWFHSTSWTVYSQNGVTEKKITNKKSKASKEMFPLSLSSGVKCDTLLAIWWQEARISLNPPSGLNPSLPPSCSQAAPVFVIKQMPGFCDW